MSSEIKIVPIKMFILFPQDFRCPFTQNCNITPVTRRFCQKCRLDKCFSIGMRKEYIMSEEDKVLKRQKIEQNRAKKRPTGDNSKAPKVKKGCVDECTFDDTSMSINSVASTVSDTYFWESDRKYTDLDASRQNVTESLSPVTAASVPSPSSPPENGTISGSKTLDMMKNSSHNSNSNFENYDQSSPHHEETETEMERLRVNSDSPIENQQKCDKVKSVSHNLEKDKKFVISSKRLEQNALDLNSDFDSANSEPLKYSEFDNTSCYNKLDRSPVQNSPYNDHMLHSRKMNLDVTSEMHMSMQVCPEELEPCTKSSKEACPEENNLFTKYTQDPSLIIKLVNNSNFIAKIFQNEELLLKIMTDPVVISKLEADPEISKFFREDSGTVGKDTLSENKTNIQYKDDLKATVLNHKFKPAFKVKQRHIENPILTDLITNSNQEECINQRIEPSSSGDWNKNVTDVTRDVLQDVQRYKWNVNLFEIKKFNITHYFNCLLFFRVPIVANSIESILCEAIKLEFSAYSALGGMETRRELNDAERAKLNELIVANKALLAPLDDDITHLIGEDCKFKVMLIKINFAY